jgi:hypothetical protein
MDLGQAMPMVGAGDRAVSFELFSRHIDPVWIAQALQATGTATVRRRKLPAEYVVWIVVGMGLLRDRSIQEVVRHLDLVLPDAKKTPQGRGSATGSAVVQARDRLGAEPLTALFQQTARRWAGDSADALRWRGLVVYGVDGSTLRVADTEENEQTFGRPGSGRGRAGYPQLRLVALMVLRSHLLAGLVAGRCTDSELKLAEPMWETIPNDSLTIVDRGFISCAVFHQIQSHGSRRHWLTRAKSNLKWRVVKQLGPKDHLVELTVHRNARRIRPELPETLTVRAIQYQRRGFRPQILLTSLLDPEAYPAAEIAQMYHERWELEMGFDEVKTHTLEREENMLRSRAPERVRQELWGLAIGYNLVRLEMERVARHAGVPPRRISFRHALMLIRNFWVVTAWLCSPGVLPRRLDALHEELALLILPERRPRTYPRAVKIKMSNYPLKRETRPRRRLN